MSGTLDSEGFTHTPYGTDSIWGNPPVFLQQQDVQNPSMPRGHDSSAMPELARSAYVPPPTQFLQGSTTSDFKALNKRTPEMEANYIALIVFVGVVAAALWYKA